MSDSAEAIRAVLHGLEQAWRGAHPATVAEAVGDYFAADAVLLGPDLTRVARGRDAIAQSFAEFARAAVVTSMSAHEPEIDVSDDVAVATLKWEIRYIYADVESFERGHDTYVFARRDGRWLIVWRAVAAQPAPK
jgi:uncharacterized protein (TIGR02246 family)